MASIALIGSGNVAHHLGKAFFEKGHSIVGVYSKNIKNARILSQKLQSSVCAKLSELPASDFTIVSVSDNALAAVISSLHFRTGILAHTSGSVGLEVFSPNGERGVFYPLQTFSKTKSITLNNVPFLLEATSTHTANKLEKLASSISSKTAFVNSEDRKRIHLAAVIASNFTNHLLGLAQDILKEKELPLDLLKPLVQETIHKAFEMNPFEAQTGPAIRKDQQVIEAQIQALASNSLTQEIYKIITHSIQQHS